MSGWTAFEGWQAELGGKRGEGASSFLSDDVGRQHILALEHLPGPSVVENETRIVSLVVT
jgi:hypothetical protein